MSRATRKKRLRIASVDYGMKRIGMAVSDEMQLIATAVPTIDAERRMENTVQRVSVELQRLQREKECELLEVVVGMPLLMNGKIGLLGDEVLHFVDLLRKAISVPVVTWDERLTSVQADRAMREGALTRKKRNQRIDSVSAVILLQSYLNHRRELALSSEAISPEGYSA